MEASDKELEDRLREVGSRLSPPPLLSSVDELLHLLDQTEDLLSKVEQSPSVSMSNSLRPAMKALVTKELLRHSDRDVKVVVAACLSEITRVTAPEAPYDDEVMKEVFQRIVEAFENLDDISSRSFSKRVAILETVAKVRSCVVMLDLECDDLILEMFGYFLKTIRPNHAANVFSSMETIMTLVLEESEDISQDLISCLLESVKIDDDVSPDAKKLGERVIKNCAEKLKPYFMELSIQSISEYSQVVASICQGTSTVAAQNENHASGEAMADDSKLSERTISDESPQGSAKTQQEVGYPGEHAETTDKSSKPSTNNGMICIDNGEQTVEESSLKEKPEISCPSDQPKKSIDSERDLDLVDEKPDAVQDTKLKKARDRKASAIQSKDYADHSLDVSQIGKKVDSSGKDEQHSSKEGNGTSKVSAPARLGDPDITGSRPSGPAKSSKGRKQASVGKELASPSGQKESKNASGKEGKQLHLKDSDSEKEVDGFSDSDRKPLKLSSKKSQPEDTVQTPETGDVEVKSPRQAIKRGSSASKVAQGESSQKHSKSKVKQQDKLKANKDISVQVVVKKTVSSPKYVKKSQVEGNLEDGPKTSSRRKRAHDAHEVLATPAGSKLDGSIVGSKIEVWWPDDKQYYEGVVDSYDPSTKKHKIVYTDGDVEVLLLKKEQWLFVKDVREEDSDLEEDTAAPDDSVEEPRSKRSKTSSVTKETNDDTPLKSGAGSGSVSKRKGRPPKSSQTDDDNTMATNKTASRSQQVGAKSGTKLDKHDSAKTNKSDNKTGNSMKDDTAKSSRNSRDPISKVASKGKESVNTVTKVKNNDVSKGKLFEDTPKAGKKSRIATTPKSGGELKTNGTAERGKTLDQEIESSARAQSDEGKTPEKVVLTGRKRKRKGRS